MTSRAELEARLTALEGGDELTVHEQVLAGMKDAERAHGDGRARSDGPEDDTE